MIIELNENILQKLTSTELGIIKFINANEDNLPQLSIVDIADDTYSSASSVSRAIRKCGIKGFNELRYRSGTDTVSHDLRNVSEIMNKSIIEAQRIVDRVTVPVIVSIVEEIRKAGKLFVLSRGLTSYVGEEFALKLQLLNVNACSLTDPEIMRIKSRKLKEQEILFIFSLNGQTTELIESARNAVMCGRSVITCTCAPNSELVELSRHSLIGFRHEHEGIGEYEVASRVSLNMLSRIIIDYLVTYQ